MTLKEEEDRLRCKSVMGSTYPGWTVQEWREQGDCSYTLLLSPRDSSLTTVNDGGHLKYDQTLTCGRDRSFIVQIRPAQYALDLDIARAAKATYPLLVPSLCALELPLPGQLCAYEMERMRGMPLSRLLPQTSRVSPSMKRNQEQLVQSLATFIAQGWHLDSSSLSGGRKVRADSPIDDVPNMLSLCVGKVGSSIIYRLEQLSEKLPAPHLRQRAKSVLNRVQNMRNYSVVLNHGDLIPSNILVNEETWEVTGIVDWAEAEYLPFGTCLYGLEHLLGCLKPTSPSKLLQKNNLFLDKTSTFEYYSNASHLRRLFWTRLFEVAPEIKTRQDDVKAMRDMGVLLWYGYAWDDGAINRVVNETDDPTEVECLRAFLKVS